MVYNPVYKIVTGGAGGFLCPPGHPHHTHHLEGKMSPRHRDIMFSGALDYALSEGFDGSDGIRRRVREMLDAAELVPSERWIRSVYGYFRNAYAPEGGSRDVSKATFHDPARVAVDATRKALADEYSKPDGVTAALGNRDDFRDGSKKPMRAARRGYEVTAKADGSEVFVYTLADDGTRYGALPTLNVHASVLDEAGFTDVRIEAPQDRDGEFIPERVRATNPVPIEPIDPARHLAVLTVREYFPDHEPRLDLIADPGHGYGASPCTKCGEKVQYEAKFDKLAKVTTRMDGRGMTHWTYETDCPEGGDHTTDHTTD